MDAIRLNRGVSRRRSLRRRLGVLVTAMALAVGLVSGTAAASTARMDVTRSDTSQCSVPVEVCAPAVSLPPGYNYYDRLDNSWIPQPTAVDGSYVLGSYLLDEARQIPPLLWQTCIASIPADSIGRGQGWATKVLAEASLLRLVENPQGRDALMRAFTGTPSLADPDHRYRDCLAQRAPGWDLPQVPGQPAPWSTTPGWAMVMSDVRAVPAFHGKPGTPVPGIVLDCDGDNDPKDWDFTMAGIMRVFGLMNQDSDYNLFGGEDSTVPGQHNDGNWTVFKAQVSERAWLQGSKQDIDNTNGVVGGVAIPESENHEWLIRTTRFLHNELLDTIYPEPSSKCINKYDLDQNADNATNGLNDYINGITAGTVDHDWLEYNARPYSTAEMLGLLNLYDFSTDPQIKADARKVLDFMSLKHAAESMDNERIVPFRRRAEAESKFLYQDDTIDSFYEEWAGGLADPVFPLAGVHGIAGEMTTAASSSYRPPSWMVDLMLNPAHRDYVQYFNGRGQGEVAYGGPDFTMTGGGNRTDCPYPASVLNLCEGDANDPGTVEPLVLIPHQVRTAGVDRPGPGADDPYGWPSLDANIAAYGSYGENECLYANLMCSHLGGIVVPDALKHSSCATTGSSTIGSATAGGVQPADDQGPPGSPPPTPQINDLGLVINGHCLNDDAYRDTCIFVYQADITLTPAVTTGPDPTPASGTSYVATHSCDASASAEAIQQAFTAFMGYMRGAGKPSGGIQTCRFNDSQRSWVDLQLALPPTRPADLTGVTSGGDTVHVYSYGSSCDDAHDWDGATRVVGPRSIRFPGNVAGDLSLTGGRFPVTTTALASTATNTSAYGQPVPLTATVTTSPATSGATGSVTFLDGTTVLGTAPVTAGAGGAVTAVLPVSTLSVGTHRITASYGGDGTFVASLATITHSVERAPTSLAYTGVTTGPYHEDAAVAATLTNGVTHTPIGSAAVTFTLGGTDSCTATTDTAGNAACTIVPSEPAGDYSLTASFAGDGNYQPSAATQTFTVTKERTAVRYTGTTHIANAEPAHLSAVLTEDGKVGKAPIPGRTLTFVLGTGTSSRGQQTCTATTDASGTAACTIDAVNQPLTDAATVPLTVTFASDPYYLASATDTKVALQYMTGRAFGIAGGVHLLLLSLDVPATPDTGEVRTADATSARPCTATFSSLVATVHGLCGGVTTSLAPGTAVASTTAADATIGIPGLPVVAVTGVTATSTTTCQSSTGATTIGRITVAGVPITVPTAPNSTLDLAGGLRLTVNEQIPVAGSDRGLTTNAIHLTVLGGAVDLVIGSATSAVHNCG